MVGATPNDPKWGGGLFKPLGAILGDLPEPETAFERDVLAEVLSIYALLREKNRAYGNSALDPMRVFSKAKTSEQIRVRIDDKLSRLSRGAAAGEDVVRDLLGYLVLLRIAERA